MLSDQTIRQRGPAASCVAGVELGPRWSLLARRAPRPHPQRARPTSCTPTTSTSRVSAIFRRRRPRAASTFAARARRSTLYAAWGQGFLPPATEELCAQPRRARRLQHAPRPGDVARRGARRCAAGRATVSSTTWPSSTCDTQDDFERYRVPARPLETFYHNAGDSRAAASRAQLSWFPAPRLSRAGRAYTWSRLHATTATRHHYPGDLVGNCAAQLAAAPGVPRRRVRLGDRLPSAPARSC